MELKMLKILKPSDIKFQYLSLLEKNPGVTATEVAHKLSISTSQVRNQLLRYRRQYLVARTKDVDGEVRKKPWIYYLNKYGKRKLGYFKTKKMKKC
jgi:predicted transcriptional regulator